MNETQALKLCITHKDPVGFEYLVKKYHKEAYMHAYGFLNNRDDALDACQDSFTKAFKAITSLNRLPKFYPWFYTILRNTCLNIVTRSKNHSQYEDSVGTNENTYNTFDPELIITQKENSDHIKQCLAELSTEFREILILKYCNGHNYDTISTLLSIPRGTVMSRMYHARKAFQKNFTGKTDQR